MDAILLQKTQKQMEEILSRMHDSSNDAEECISLLQTAFIYNIASTLPECRTKTESIKGDEIILTKTISGISRDNPTFNKYVPIPGHLANIALNLEKLSELIANKISNKILYSDKAVNEVMFLLQRLAEIIRPTSDMILARNRFLSKYVEESASEIVKMADEYATFHEDRLIRGECLPVASSQFIGILNAIKSIAWHAKEVTMKVLT